MPIADNVKRGRDVIIHHPELVNLYGCEIGDDTRVAAFVEIGKGVKVGRGCRIQSGAYIPKGVTIEDNVFIGPHVCFTNCRKPQLPSEGFEVVPTLVKEGATIGAGATILCGVTIGRNAVVGMGAVVISDVEDGWLVVGNPAGGYTSREGQLLPSGPLR